MTPQKFSHDPVESTRTTTRTHPHPNADTVCVRVVQRVAALTGVDATDLPPLERVVDCDALKALFGPGIGGHPRSGIRAVTFEYAGYRVHVEPGGLTCVPLSADRD